MVYFFACLVGFVFLYGGQRFIFFLPTNSPPPLQTKPKPKPKKKKKRTCFYLSASLHIIEICTNEDNRQMLLTTQHLLVHHSKALVELRHIFYFFFFPQVWLRLGCFKSLSSALHVFSSLGVGRMWA